ncbi:MAG TPA: CNNM domain-containing protein, partial [Candidatus Binataceae bacterium]|nr:CNNM domain-containing protein [Candidatus Binataceae bacterium]
MTALLPVAIIILIVLSAAIAASETALFSLVRMEHTRESLHRAVREALERLMTRPLESLVVIIGLNEACNIFAECLATIYLIRLFGEEAGPWIAAPAMFA